MTLHDTLRNYADMTEQACRDFLPLNEGLQKELVEAMEYSLLSGGKRIRAALTLEFARLCGADPQTVLAFACAVEMVHGYSLIHDDLPCMDNSLMRRGKPSCHAAYGETTALLAGDALLSLAFETMTKADQSKISAESIIRCIGELGFASGAEGMVGGQVIDLMMEEQQVNEDVLIQMHLGKTGRMIICAARIGCIAANASPKQLEAATQYAASIGRVFQIVDDILDVTGDETVLGKPIGGDAQLQKTTYASLMGVSAAYDLAKQINQQAKQVLRAEFGKEADMLVEFADYLLDRKL